MCFRPYAMTLHRLLFNVSINMRPVDAREVRGCCFQQGSWIPPLVDVMVRPTTTTHTYVRHITLLSSICHLPIQKNNSVMGWVLTYRDYQKIIASFL